MLSLMQNKFLGSHLWFFCGLILTQILCPWIVAVRTTQLAEGSKCIWTHLLLASGSCLAGEARVPFSSPYIISVPALLLWLFFWPLLNKEWELWLPIGLWVAAQKDANTPTSAAQSFLCFSGVGGSSPQLINEHCSEAQVGSYFVKDLLKEIRFHC